MTLSSGAKSKHATIYFPPTEVTQPKGWHLKMSRTLDASEIGNTSNLTSHIAVGGNSNKICDFLPAAPLAWAHRYLVNEREHFPQR